MVNVAVEARNDVGNPGVVGPMKTNPFRPASANRSRWSASSGASSIAVTAGVRRAPGGQPADLLGKCLLAACRRQEDEPADLQADHHLAATGGRVQQPPLVAAVDPWETVSHPGQPAKAGPPTALALNTRPPSGGVHRASNLTFKAEIVDGLAFSAAPARRAKLTGAGAWFGAATPPK